LVTTSTRLTTLEGRVTKAESAISALTGRVSKLEQDVTTLSVLMGGIGSSTSPFVNTSAGLASAIVSGYDTGVIVTPGSSPTLIQGFGARALQATGSGTWTVSNTNTGTGAGTFLGGLAAIAAGTHHILVFSIDGTFVVPNQVNQYSNASNFIIDGRGRSITLTGGNIKFSNCDHFAVVNIRHRGGWNGVQDADNFTIVESDNYAFVNCSISGGYDEGLSSTRGSSYWTVQDCLFGPGESQSASAIWDYPPDGVNNHNFGSLNYGHTIGSNGPGSFIRCAWVAKNYRNPKIGYRNDGNSTPDPGPITGDIINNVVVVSNYAVTADTGAKVNNMSPYTSGNARANESINGGVIGTSFAVESFARSGITILSSDGARAYAKANAGTTPRDAFDTTLLARIP